MSFILTFSNRSFISFTLKKCFLIRTKAAQSMRTCSTVRGMWLLYLFEYKGLHKSYMAVEYVKCITATSVLNMILLYYRNQNLSRFTNSLTQYTHSPAKQIKTFREIIQQRCNIRDGQRQGDNPTKV